MGSTEETVLVDTAVGKLEGTLMVPDGARAIVLFAHGSGSSRFSPRNRYVAEWFQRRGLATLLLDLLTTDEEAIDLRTRHLRFDIDLLSSRLVDAIDWLELDQRTRGLGIGLFGASTGAAAALIAAASRPESVRAVVSRGGRPDLARPALPLVESPTLLIVGGEDHGVIELNAEAFDELGSHKQLFIVPGATHLFEEPGALAKVAERAGDWFVQYAAERFEPPRPHAPRRERRAMN